MIYREKRNIWPKHYPIFQCNTACAHTSQAVVCKNILADHHLTGIIHLKWRSEITSFRKFSLKKFLFHRFNLLSLWTGVIDCKALFPAAIHFFMGNCVILFHVFHVDCFSAFKPFKNIHPLLNPLSHLIRLFECRMTVHITLVPCAGAQNHTRFF